MGLRPAAVSVLTSAVAGCRLTKFLLFSHRPYDGCSVGYTWDRWANSRGNWGLFAGKARALARGVIVCKAVGSDSRENAPSPPRCSMVLAGSAESRRCGIAVSSRALLVSPGQGAASTRRTGEEQRHLTAGFRPQVRAEAYCLRRVEHDGLLRPLKALATPSRVLR